MPPEIRPSQGAQPGSPGVVSNESVQSTPQAETPQKEQPPKLDPHTEAKNAQSSKQLANDTKNQDTARIQILRNELTQKLPENKAPTPQTLKDLLADSIANGPNSPTVLKDHVQFAAPVGPAMELPGRMMTVTIYDENNKSIASQTVPLQNNAKTETITGEINGGSIQWDGGRTVNAKIGNKLDAQGRPTDGVSIDEWARKQGQGHARYIRIEISDAMLKDGKNATGNSAPAQNSGKSKSSNAGKGSVGESPSTAGGVAKNSTASGGGKPVENAADDTSSKAGRNTKYPGEEKIGGRGHEDKGPVHRGNPSLNKEGGVHGKWDGNKEKVGYFHDPDKTGKGREDIRRPNTDKDGMVGGSGKPGDDGVPSGGAIKPMVPVPKSVKPYLEAGMILANASIIKVGDDMIETVIKLSKKGHTSDDALKAAIKGKFDDFVKKETDTVIDNLKRNKEFTSKSAEEQAQILRDTKNAVEDIANDKIVSHLDRKTAEHLDVAKKAQQNPSEFSADVINEEAKRANAAFRAKEAMPTKPIRELTERQQKEINEMVANGFDRKAAEDVVRYRGYDKVDFEKQPGYHGGKPRNPLKPPGPKVK